MNLEQRLVAVEAELAEIKAQQRTTEELSKLIREACSSSIKSAQRPGGMLYAAQKQAAPVIEIRNSDGVITSRLSRI